jgi:hypothetical protein
MPAWIKWALKIALNWLLRELQEELEQGIVITYKGFRIRIKLEKTREETPDQTYLLML